MSRSYRKNVFGSWGSSSSLKGWRTQENRRLRHNAKQLINTCLDFDNLIIPVLNDYDTLWGSPQDGKKRPIPVPFLNQCEVDLEKDIRRAYRWYEFRPDLLEKSIERAKKRYVHGSYECDCYSNKRGWYWRMKRK